VWASACAVAKRRAGTWLPSACLQPQIALHRGADSPANAHPSSEDTLSSSERKTCLSKLRRAAVEARRSGASSPIRPRSLAKRALARRKSGFRESRSQGMPSQGMPSQGMPSQGMPSQGMPYLGRTGPARSSSGSSVFKVVPDDKNPNALPTGAQVGAPTSARTHIIDPVATAVMENMPALLVGSCADRC
jgi:hypothetical protein